MYKRIIGIGLLLALFTGLSGLAVASANNVTKDILEQQLAAAKEKSLREVYPIEGEIKDESEKYLNGQELEEILAIYVSYQGDIPQGVIYLVETNGFNGAIQTMIGFDIASQAIAGVKVTQQSETPGLGDNAKHAWFGERFLGKRADRQLEVTKFEPQNDNEVQALTSATITSTAVVKGVNIAREHFVQNFVTAL